MIQQQIMLSLGLTRRPNVPRRRNMSDADIERLLPLLQQQDDSINDSDSTARLYVVKRVHALLPTCEFITPAPAHSILTASAHRRRRDATRQLSHVGVGAVCIGLYQLACSVHRGRHAEIFWVAKR